MVFVFFIGCALFLIFVEVFIWKAMIKDKYHSQYCMLYWSIIYNYGSKYSEIKSCYKSGCFDKISYKEKIKTIKYVLKCELRGLKNEYKKIR